MTKNEVKFSIQVEGKPDGELNYAAYVFSNNGTFISMSPVQNQEFSLQLKDSNLDGKRILIAPYHPEDARKKTPDLRDIEQIAYEPGIKETVEGTVYLHPIPQYYWQNWFICFCRVHGKVLNLCGDSYKGVYKARVHVCEVDPIIIWLNKLPDTELFTLRNDILKTLQEKPIIRKPPLPDPPPDFSALTGISQISRITSVNPNALAANSLQLSDITEAGADKKVLLADTIEKTNKALLYSDSAQLVRQYFVDHYILFYPWFCYFWRPFYWYRCDEIRIIETDENGIFDGTISYFCRGDKPDLYFWVEYNIDGVWTTVYRPSIICHTYWNYTCGSTVYIYLNDQRIPCIQNPLVAGKVVIVNTLGRNVNVNQVPQTIPIAAGSGLTKYGQPLGGSIEPNVTFGEGLLTAANPVKYYRWSYKKYNEADTQYKPLLTAVNRHFLHIEWVAGEFQYSYPVYNLGPKPSTAGLFEIQPARHPVTHEPWAVIDGRYDTASAFFNSPALENGNVALAAGFYYLKLELFHADTSPVNFTADGIDLRVPDATIDAPFTNQVVPLVNPANDYKIKNGSGDVVGFKMLIRVDNNPTFGLIHPTQCDGATAGDCGFLKYVDKNTSHAIISFLAGHPNDFSTYGFNIFKGSVGSVYSSGGPTPPAPHEVIETKLVKDLLDAGSNCDKAAFAENLHVAATATDGWSRLDYLDKYDTKAFALTN